ncbi:MAG: tRNA pseudouridine(55) synthase TruB [Oscillospiraceae bacterium]|jgi:tRNA pseudouridine55 synthase
MSESGIIILDKPSGYTSFDCVARMRGILGIKRIGHGGTLDPMATGVLPVFCGRAAKAIRFAPDTTKEYEALVSVGIKTDTGDITGTEVGTSEAMPEEDELRSAAQSFIGRTSQIPPMYSAVKIGGKHLYDIARTGRTVEREPREIEIFSIEITSYSSTGKQFGFRTECSSGTYVRTLAEDICEKAGTVGTLSSLRRTRCMGFGEKSAVSLERLESSDDPWTFIRPLEDLFTGVPKIVLDDADSRRFLNGAKVYSGRPEGEEVLVADRNGLLGIGKTEGGLLVKLVHLAED